MADDAAAREQHEEEDEEEEGAEEGAEEDEEEDELKNDVTPTPPSLVEEEEQQQLLLLQQDVGPADPSGPMSSNPPAPSAPGPPAVCKELQQVEVELRLLEALEIYHPSKLLGMHRHFILYGLIENLERRIGNYLGQDTERLATTLGQDTEDIAPRLNHRFTAGEILELLDRFYNLELLKPDEDEMELLSQEEEFSLPPSILAVKEEPRGSS